MTEFRVVEAILAVVEDLCAERPVAIAVDDLQWADPSTLLVLHRLARYVDELPLLLLGCWRSLPRRRELELLASVATRRHVTQITVGPLDEAALLDLLRLLIDADPGPNLLRLASGTGGNPLFLTELVRALEREGALTPDDDGRVDAPSSSLPPSLPLAILHRLSYLSDEALEVLQLAAVLGSRVDVAELCLILARPASSLLSVLHEVTGAGIFKEEDGKLLFGHDVVREALYQDLPGPVRAQLHLEVARVLSAAGARPERVAEHAARGASVGDRFVVESLRRAAAEAAPRAPAVAVELLDQALDLAEADDPLRAALGAEKAVTLLWAGRVTEAESTCRHLLAFADEPSPKGRVELCLAQVLFSRGQAREAVEMAQTATRAPGLSDPERAQIRAWASLGHMAAGELDEAVEAARATTTVTGVDELAMAVSLTTLATAASFTGRFHEGVELQRQATVLADLSTGRLAHRFPLNFFRGMFLAEVDDLVGAQEALQRGRRISEEIGARWNLPLYAWASAWVRFLTGSWDDALADCDASLALADELGTHHGILFAHSLQSLISLHRGDLDRAAHAVTAAEAEFAATGPQHGLENVMAWARALLAASTGQAAEALAILSSTWDGLAESGVVAYRFDLGPDLVRLAIANGELARATAVTSAVEELAAVNPELSRASGCARHCRGLVEASPRLLEQAVDDLRTCGRPLEVAVACEDLGDLLGRAGQPARARLSFEEALAGYERLEAWRSVARTEARMRQVGLRRGSRARRARPKSGWASLTSTERSVAELVASGLSNPQIAERLFVSRHTVHTHVSHVLAKLHLTSRVQLAAEAGIRRGQQISEEPQQLEPADERERRALLDDH